MQIAFGLQISKDYHSGTIPKFLNFITARKDNFNNQMEGWLNFKKFSKLCHEKLENKLVLEYIHPCSENYIVLI